ncbi:hypothetical protein [Actinomyces trachealis]|uniref:hypothetical protein n=1 Tax=Actinomyces trachealis TaxID=2763540 RepID=UPI001892B428|nr:hypothetical protein [Actinomyces trachealis]
MTPRSHFPPGGFPSLYPATAVLFATLLLLGLATPTAAAHTPSPPPEPVTEWVRAQAPQVVSAATPGRVAPGDLSFGDIVRVSMWDDAFLRGEAQGNGLKEADHWAATVQVLGQTVGAIHMWIGPSEADVVTPAPAEAQDAAVNMAVPTPASPAPTTAAASADSKAINGEFVGDPVLGNAIARLSGQQANGDARSYWIIVHDSVDHSWFAVNNGVVRPLGQTSTSVLAGELPVNVYSQIVRDRRAKVPVENKPVWDGWLPGNQLIWLAVGGFSVLTAAVVFITVRHERQVLTD